MCTRSCGIGGRYRVALSCAATFLTVPLASCDDGPAPPEATSLAVAPSSITLSAIGDTAVFTAAVTDQFGDAFPGAVMWRSSRPAVFTVTGGGVARAVANGEGVLTASFGGLSATANVAVAQQPSAMEVVAGDGQAARQGLALAEEVEVEVTDARGTAVEDVVVVFAPAPGDGIADPDTAATDADGLARTSWTLGDRPGPQILVASLVGAGGRFVRASATALTPEETADSVRIVAGDQQRVLLGRALPEAVVALVLDSAGNPVPGARVAFAPADGHGAADPDTAATDADGLAAAAWTLGDQPGPQSLAAAVARPGGPTAQAAATALTPEEAADSVEVASGNHQRARQGVALRRPVAFRVLDQMGRPVPGARVAFAPADGHGAADPDTAATDADGLAAAAWTLGDQPGPQSLAAAVARPGGPTAQAAATALAPREPTADSIAVVSGDAQSAPRGDVLPAPVVVVVLDGTGRPLSDVRVSFATAPGHGQALPESDRTDADGRAQTRWTLGNPLGQQRLVATAADGPSVQVTATAVERPVTNRPPTVAETVPTLVLQAGGASVSVAARSLFSDPDGDALDFSAATGDPGVAQVAVRRDTIVVSPATATGSAKIRLAATDPYGAVASQAFWTTVLPAPDTSGYDIHIADFTELGIGADTSFTRAVERWEQAITADLPNQALLSDFVFDACLRRFRVFAEVDDLVVFVTARDIDGPGGTLAAANLCAVRRPEDTGLPVFGFIYFDAADRTGPWAGAYTYAVTLHELGHVFGIGSSAGWQGLLANPSRPSAAGADTHFAGALARTAFDTAGGTAYTAGEKVPVENRAIAGSSDSHWRLSVMGDELMSPVIWIAGGNLLSNVTLQALADLGYVVDASAADAWTYTSPSPDAMAAVRRGQAVHMKDDIAPSPILVLDENGRVIRITRR